MSWNKSYFSGQSGNNQYSSSTDGYGGDQNEATSDKKRPPSNLKKSGSTKAAADYTSYTAKTNHDGDNNGNNNYNSAYSNNGGYNGYGSTPYNNGESATPYYDGGGRNNSNSSYNNGGDGYTGGATIPYNAPTAFWTPQDGTRPPVFINTREVHVYEAPGSQYDGNNSDQRRRGGDSGFFGPAFEAVGHFLDRKLGFQDRD